MKIENKDGVISINGKKMSEIPAGMSMFGVHDANPFLENSRYDQDGWVYVNGKRAKKWYTKAYSDGGTGVFVWPPVLRDPASLEIRYQKMKEKADKFYLEVWRPAYDKVMEAGAAHAKPTHGGSNDHWWVYRRNDWSNHEPTLGFDWLDEGPSELINHDVGQAYYEADRKMGRNYKYVALFRLALERAIKLMLMAQYPPKEREVSLKLTINGRDFWYVSVEYSNNYYEWKKLVWPEDKLIEMTL